MNRRVHQTSGCEGRRGSRRAAVAWPRRVGVKQDCRQPALAGQGGFTLTELLIVVVIVLILTFVAVPAILTTVGDRKFSQAGRVVQAALLAARDRAISQNRVAGIRLIRDATDPWEVSTLVYVAVPEPYSVGRVTVSGTGVAPVIGGADPDPGFGQVDPGADPVSTLDDIPRVVPGASLIRFDHAGAMYLVTGLTPAGGSTGLTIAPPAVTVAGPPASHTYQLFSPPVPVSDADPVTLPAGTVIDVRGAPITAGHPLAGTEAEAPRSRRIPNQIPPAAVVTNPPQTWPTMDILFGPDGQVVNLQGWAGLIHFWIGERGDKGSHGPDGQPGTADDIGPSRPHRMLTLDTRTGAVQVANILISVGTAPEYQEVYGPVESSFGESVLELP